MELGMLLAQYTDIDPDRKHEIESFTKVFYSSCQCKHQCHLHVDFAVAFSTYKNYSSMEIDELNISISWSIEGLLRR